MMCNLKYAIIIKKNQTSYRSLLVILLKNGLLQSFQDWQSIILQ